VIRRRENKIYELNIEGVWCTDVETLRMEVEVNKYSQERGV
jgi:hypothetical protein